MFASNLSGGISKGQSSKESPSHSIHSHRAQTHFTLKSSRSSSSASDRSRARGHHEKSGKMAITDTSTNRMAIHALLNDTARDTPRLSGNRSSMKDYQCDLCYKSFTQRADVRKHKKTVHEKARDFHCDECSLSFGERGNLNKHVRSIHRKERNFFCEQCDATFPFRNGLTEHTRMKHTNERPYECGACSSTFKKKSHLHRHVTVVHKTSL